MSKKDLQGTNYNPFKEITIRLDELEKKISEIHSSLKDLPNSFIEKIDKQRVIPEQEIEVDRLDKKQAARILKVSVRTIERYIKNGSIPYVQHGGKVTFSLKELTNSKFNRRHKNTHIDHLSILVTNPTKK